MLHWSRVTGFCAHGANIWQSVFGRQAFFKLFGGCDDGRPIKGYRRVVKLSEKE